jgi:hypothetical protein
LAECRPGEGAIQGEPEESGPPQRHARRVAIVIALVVLASLIAPFVDARAIPFAKWPQFIGYALLAWMFAQWCPDVWENRHDDKFAVAFVGILIFLMLFGMWNILANWP